MKPEQPESVAPGSDTVAPYADQEEVILSVPARPVDEVLRSASAHLGLTPAVMAIDQRIVDQRDRFRIAAIEARLDLIDLLTDDDNLLAQTQIIRELVAL